nr:MAG TPA: response regulator [Caudoviricetes sp.]
MIMSTNVNNLEGSSNIPAGFFSGTEIFAFRGKMYALKNGNLILFENLPSVEKRQFLNLYLQDREGQKFIHDNFGIVGFEAGFKKWLFCKFGSLDGNPDYISGKITPDMYNSACLDTRCPGRGKFCGRDSGLKGFEIETLRALKNGKTIIEIAEELHVSISAIKSRYEKLKTQFAVANAAALAAIATELGI